MPFPGDFLTVAAALAAARGRPEFTADPFVPASLGVFFVILILCLFLLEGGLQWLEIQRSERER